MPEGTQGPSIRLSFPKISIYALISAVFMAFSSIRRTFEKLLTQLVKTTQSHHILGRLTYAAVVIAAVVFLILGPINASAETRVHARHLVKTNLTFDLIIAVPPAEYVFGECATESFVSTTRPIEFAGSEPARTRDPFSQDQCPWPSGIDHSRYIGKFFPTSLNDLGTYTIRCTNIIASGPPYTYDEIVHIEVGVCPGLNRFTIGPVTPREDHVIEFEVYNYPPIITSISHDGMNVLPTGAVAYNGNINITANARDPDGGRVSVSWIVERPPGARGIVGPLSSSVLNVQFRDESDFGMWRFQALADDDEGERVQGDYTINVVNQNPRPVISGPARVPFSTEIELAVSPDEDGGDYSSIRWEALAPGSTIWRVVGGSTPSLTVPTDISAVGEWRFRVQVRDNDEPLPLAGTSPEYIVEVYNDPPQLTLESVEARVPEAGGIIVIAGSAIDPDGGDVLLTVRAFQVPDTSSTSAGTVVARGQNSIRYVHTAHDGDAGTWIFEVTATDDEPVPWQKTDKEEAVVVVDAPPTAQIEGPERVGLLTGMIALTSEDSDPDSPCLTERNRCHSTADGSPVRAISPDIVRRVWTLVDAALDDGSYFPTGNVRDVFDISGNSAMIEVPPDKLKPGLFTFQLEVEDGEANIGEAAYHQIEVIGENTPPLAYVSPPTRHLVSVLGVAPTDISVNGVFSFDPDNILTDDLPGIEAYNWSLVYGPLGCITPVTSPVFTLYRAGTAIPADCQSIYALKLTVTDDDRPTGRTASAETAVSIGTCPGTVCIDLPTSAMQRMVEFADDTDVLILYHVDPSAVATFPFGMSARLDIFHESSPSPIFTSYSPNVRTTALTPLLVFHWNGYWFAERPRPGRYSVQISLVDHVFNPAGPLFQAQENNAILIEVDELKIASDSDRYVLRTALEDRSDVVSIPYKIIGGITPDRKEWRLVNEVGAVVYSDELGPDLEGILNWDGRINPSEVAVPGRYTVEMEAFRGGVSLTGIVRHPLTIYELRLEPIAGPSELTLMVNNDDDNLNGIADNSEPGIVVGENDLRGVNLVLNPPIEGRLSLTTTGAASLVKLYGRADRWGGEVEPIPGVVYLEGISAGDGYLRLQLQPSDAGVLTPVDTPVSVIEIAVKDRTFAPASALNIAIWENAYQFAEPFPVRNTAIDNFVDREDRRFYVHVDDPRANTGPARVETAEVEISTVFDNGAIDDNPTRIMLRRDPTGTPESDGSLQSNAQILVTPDLPENPDDDFTVHDGAHDLRNDDEQDDRTHRATIDGAVRITYRPVGSQLLDFTVPVCERNPEARRVVEIRAWIFYDPRTALPAATRAFVEAEVAKANIAWSPACLKFRLTDAPRDVIAPNAVTAMGPVNILADGRFNVFNDDESLDLTDISALISAYAGSARIDRFELFVVPRILGANAFTIGPRGNFPALGLNTFIVMSSNTTGNRTLAHELGHALGNTPDRHTFTYVFYPSRRWQAGDPLPEYPRVVDDTSISTYRRVFDPDLTDARTDRALSHAVPGDITSPPPPPDARGNYGLKMP